MAWLLGLCLSSLAITGISFVDNQIWSQILSGISALSFTIVGYLYKAGIISGKKEGSESFKNTFIILCLIAYGIWSALNKLNNWVKSWPLYVKIIVIVASILLASLFVFLIIRKKCKNDDK